MPSPPFVNPVLDTDTHLSGTCDAGATVSVYQGPSGATLLGSTLATPLGTWSFSIVVKPAGTVLQVNQTVSLTTSGNAIVVVSATSTDLRVPQVVVDCIKSRLLVGNCRPRVVVTFTKKNDGTAISAAVQPGHLTIGWEAGAQAQRCQFEWPNVDFAMPFGTGVGYYSPDRGIDNPSLANPWQGYLMPGTEFNVAIGYGINTVRVFTGQIDDVSLKASPDQGFTIALEGRDMGWRLVDKACTSNTGAYSLTYKNWPVESVVKDLLLRAGWPESDISLQATGMAVTEVTFDQQTYGNAIEWCLEATGFELVIDVFGKVSFHYPTDRQPTPSSPDQVILYGSYTVGLSRKPIIYYSEVVTNTTSSGVTGESATLTGGTPSALAHKGLVVGTLVVKNTAGTITYVEGHDYVVDYRGASLSRLGAGAITSGQAVSINYSYLQIYRGWDSASSTWIDYQMDYLSGSIKRVPTGAIGDGQTVRVDYVYAAYRFNQGEDLFSLDYKISRRNVYASVYVRGTQIAKSDPPVYYNGSSPYPGRAAYGIPADRVLFSHLQDLDSDLLCQMASKQMVNDMSKHVREASFEASCVPWVRVGDCVQVVESSSTISEIYRITGMDIQFTDAGLSMTCRSYHYGYQPL